MGLIIKGGYTWNDAGFWAVYLSLGGGVAGSGVVAARTRGRLRLGARVACGALCMLTLYFVVVIGLFAAGAIELFPELKIF